MSTFHPFPRLPLELRQRIWELSMEPRNVEVGMRSDLLEQRTTPPPLLQTCAESRSLLQHFYKKAFASAILAGKYCWVNFDIDSIHIRLEALSAFGDDIYVPAIQHLVIECRTPHAFTERVDQLRHATALESLIVVGAATTPGEDPRLTVFGLRAAMNRYYQNHFTAMFSTEITALEDMSWCMAIDPRGFPSPYADPNINPNIELHVVVDSEEKFQNLMSLPTEMGGVVTFFDDVMNLNPPSSGAEDEETEQI